MCLGRLVFALAFFSSLILSWTPGSDAFGPTTSGPTTRPFVPLPNPWQKTFDAEYDRVGECPRHWEITSTHPGKANAAWEVTKDATAPSAPNVLKIVKNQNSGSTYNLAVLAGTDQKDGSVSVKIRADGGKEDQGGGLVWRYQDENNYYICRINPLESNFRVYKVVEGTRTQLASVDVKLETGKWYQLEAGMRGEAIGCTLDKHLKLGAKDDAITKAGRSGLWTKADASSSFDDFKWSGEPIRLKELPR